MLFLTLAKLLMRVLAIVVCFALSLAEMRIPAAASTLQQLSLEEMAQKSTAIVRARVTGSGGVLRGADIYTVYQLAVLETVKGQNGAGKTEVALPGGVAGGMRQVVVGSPTLHVGQEYVLFLWTSRSGLTQLMGMSQGLFAVERTPAGDLISTRAAAGEQMLDGKGYAVRDQILSMPWPELKNRIGKSLAGNLAAAVTAGSPARSK